MAATAEIDEVQTIDPPSASVIWDDRTRHEEHAADVDAHQVAPVLDFDVEERSDGDGAGVVEEHRDVPQIGADRSDGVLSQPLGDSRALASGSSTIPTAPLLCEELTGGEPAPSCAAADEGDLAFQTTGHESCLNARTMASVTSLRPSARSAAKMTIGTIFRATSAIGMSNGFVDSAVVEIVVRGTWLNCGASTIVRIEIGTASRTPSRRQSA